MSNEHPKFRQSFDRRALELYGWNDGGKTTLRSHMSNPYLYYEYRWVIQTYWDWPAYSLDKRKQWPDVDPHRVERALELCNTYAGVKSTAWKILIKKYFDGEDPVNWKETAPNG